MPLQTPEGYSYEYRRDPDDPRKMRLVPGIDTPEGFKAAEDTGQFNPNLRQAWNQATGALGRYTEAVQPHPEISGLEKGLQDVGPYRGFNWQKPAYTPQTYNQFQYKMPDANLPEYQAARFNYADQYRPSQAYNPFQFKAPQIEALRQVEPETAASWDARRAQERERIVKSFGDQRQQIQDAITSGQTRPEQAAALLARLNEQQEGAQRTGAMNIGLAQSGQLVGIRQQEQQLGLQRGMQQASFQQQQQENQAREMAQKYNMDIDQARYLVQIQQSQQTQQAGENLGAAQYGLQRGGILAGQQERLQQAQAGEGRYGYEQGLGEARYQTGLNQALQEQRAGEYGKEYQSRYGLAQDVAQTRMQQYEANKAAKTDYYNAMLQGTQAATGQFGQAATYQTNLTEGERQKQAESNQYWSGVAGGIGGAAGSAGGAATGGGYSPSKTAALAYQQPGQYRMPSNQYNYSLPQYRQPQQGQQQPQQQSQQQNQGGQGQQQQAQMRQQQQEAQRRQQQNQQGRAYG